VASASMVKISSTGAGCCAKRAGDKLIPANDVRRRSALKDFITGPIFNFKAHSGHSVTKGQMVAFLSIGLTNAPEHILKHEEKRPYFLDGANLALWLMVLSWNSAQ
jgi:hypothetical protein